MLQAAEALLACDYVYYLDVDSRFVRPVGEEIFGDLVATIHFGYCQDLAAVLPVRDRAMPAGPRSVPRKASGTTAAASRAAGPPLFVAAMQAMAAAIAEDEERGIVARWHDESHWNRYLIDHPPAIVLSHDYSCPPQWRPESQRIVIVGKNNSEVRS